MDTSQDNQPQQSEEPILPSSYDIDVLVDFPLWHDNHDDIEVLVRGTLSLCLHHLKSEELLQGFETVEVSCLLSHDDKIQELNKHFRDKNKPTNVLSFASCDLKTKVFELEGSLMLGDIILSYETIRIEAQDQGKTFENHLRHLLIHGLLHLLGYDHIDNEEAHEMEQLETALLRVFGVHDPYQHITE